ncbi:hypothetical protein BDV38DRAFT_284990 [Aspergillus pseudotamarii]|uniref:Uncharacterized protein n=1 Tax=Aspergillus pseudotamarii TaxID=132259 RepID=A0A5N6SLD2_ASPPS|nr:uncharacterized protein BDV38DRAFT_284990 [Aspergillus pseudotamarii]KAE8135355.1 hypothetical protein BDV38DRAFT_284990 [Aspergillus pseudotamarii]
MSTDGESDESWPLLADEGRKRIARYQPQNRAYDEMVKPSLCAFIDWLPEGGRESIARDCIKATTDDDLYQVFKNLFTGLAIPMKTRSKLPSVTDSPDPNRQNNVEVIAGILDQFNTRGQDFHHGCLRRDSYKCVITGEMDTKHWESLGCPEGIDFAPTEGAHIIPFTYASWDTSTGRAKAWEVLYRCFPGSVHDQFGPFNIVLQPTNLMNKYEVKYFYKYPPSDRRLLPETIELKKAKDTEQLALPNRALLDCHYRLAEILNASGLGEIIERHADRWKNLKVSTYNAVIREDGGTNIGEFLDAGLWQYIIAQRNEA